MWIEVNGAWIGVNDVWIKVHSACDMGWGTPMTWIGGAQVIWAGVNGVWLGVQMP